MNKSRIIILLVIIIVAIAVVIFYFSRETVVAPTLTPTASLNLVLYENKQYGFNFELPDSWRNYSIIIDKWEGYLITNENGQNKPDEIGPKILIRHPLWTAQTPRQDIPIMVFTLVQWNLIQQEKLSVSAAPIGPSELGRNSKYVFALPARYNYAFPTGWEEVDQIIQSHALKAF